MGGVTIYYEIKSDFSVIRQKEKAKSIHAFPNEW